MWYERRIDWKRVLLTTVAALLVMAALAAAGQSASMSGADAAVTHIPHQHILDARSGV